MATLKNALFVFEYVLPLLLLLLVLLGQSIRRVCELSRLKEPAATCTIQLRSLQVPADIEVAVRLDSLLVCSSLLG